MLKIYGESITWLLQQLCSLNQQWNVSDKNDWRSLSLNSSVITSFEVEVFRFLQKINRQLSSLFTFDWKLRLVNEILQQEIVHVIDCHSRVGFWHNGYVKSLCMKLDSTSCCIHFFRCQFASNYPKKEKFGLFYHPSAGIRNVDVSRFVSLKTWMTKWKWILLMWILRCCHSSICHVALTNMKNLVSKKFSVQRCLVELHLVVNLSLSWLKQSTFSSVKVSSMLIDYSRSSSWYFSLRFAILNNSVYLETRKIPYLGLSKSSCTAIGSFLDQLTLNLFFS